jgi:hypothetical protein
MERSFGKGGDAGNSTRELSEKINFLAQDNFFLLTGAF